MRDMPMTLKRDAFKTSLDVIFQLYLCFAVFFILTGGAFISPKKAPGLGTFLILTGFLFGYLRRRRDPSGFWLLMPFRCFRFVEALPPRLFVFGITALFFLMQFSYQLFMHFAFETSLWDLGIWQQVIWNTAFGDTFISSVRGGIHFFSERVKPMLILIAPFYRIYDSPATLFFISSLLSSAALSAAYGIGAKVTASHRWGLGLALSLFFYQPFRYSVSFLFHTQTLADPLILLAFLSLLHDRRPLFYGFILLALLCKESILIDGLGLALFLIFQKRRDGILLLAIDLALIALLVFVIEPKFHYPFAFVNKWNFFSHLLHPSWEGYARLLSPNPLVFLLKILGPLAFFPLLAPGWGLLLGPSLMFRLLNGWEGFRLITAHYNSGLNALLVIAAAYGCRRIREWPRRESLALAALMVCTLSLSSIPQLFRLQKLVEKASSLDHQHALKILENIPKKYSVASCTSLAAHVSRRRYYFAFFEVYPGTPYESRVDSVDLVIWDKAAGEGREHDKIQYYQTLGYKAVFETPFIAIYANPGLYDKPDALSLVEGWRRVVASQPKAFPWTKIARGVFFPLYALFFLGCAAGIRRSFLDRPH